MATFSGRGGIATLKAKIRDQGRSLIQEAVLDITENIVDNTPVGAEYYKSKKLDLLISNEQGDLKNNWHIDFDSIQEVADRDADTTGSGSIVGAYNTLDSYNAQETVYLTNSMHYAHNVEYGYPERPEYGWKAKEGYHFVEQSKGEAKLILLRTAQKLSE